MKSFKIIILLLLTLSFKQVKSQSDSLKAYPNPFTDTLNLQIYLASNDTVTITVVSVIGQIVKTLAHDSVMLAGNNIIVYDASSLMNGIYFVMMKVDTLTTVKKVIKTSATNSIETITESVNRITIFPNPNNGNIIIQSLNELGLISIYNTVGKLVYQEEIKSNSVQVNLSEHVSGIYFVKIQNQFTKLIIK